jgi:hypothetical protein
MSTATRTRPKAADAPAAPPPPDRFVLTASLADQARQKREAVQDFALTATAPGAYARVRLVDLSDQATLSSLPESLLRRVLGIANDIELREGKTTPVQDDGSLDIERAIRLAKANARAIDAYCVAGFVEPSLIFSEEDRIHDAQVIVSDIHPADRTRFFEWCQGRHTEAAAAVEPFPGAQQLDSGVDAGRSGRVDRAATKRAAVPAPDGGDDRGGAA